MMRYTCFLLAVTVFYGCQTHAKKSSDAQQPATNILTAADLSTPNYAPMNASDFKAALSSERDLFEYDSQQKTALRLADASPNDQCFASYFKKHPASASGTYLKLQFDNSQELIDCYLKGFADAFAKASKESNGNATVTPADPNKKYDPIADCAAGTGSSWSQLPKAGGVTLAEYFSDKDVSGYDGKSAPDISEAYQPNFLPFTRKGRVAIKIKNFSDGTQCVNKVYGTFTSQQVYTQDCQVDINDATTTTWNCSTSYRTTLSNVKTDVVAFETLRKSERGDHFVNETSENVVKKIGSTYPISGKKTVTYRNWNGTITFSSGKPSYEFSNGTETVSGSFTKD